MRRIPRTWAAVLLALQALLWVAGPLIDGAVEASSARTQAHVEELGGTKCPPVHSALDCLICRTLSQGAVMPSADAVGSPSRANGPALGETSACLVEGVRSGGLGSRAPPSA